MRTRTHIITQATTTATGTRQPIMPTSTSFSTRGVQGSRFDVQSWTFQPDLNWADGQDEDDEDSTDALEGSLVEVTESEIPSYFCERDGRLFHSHGASPYPLPVDTPEHQVRVISLDTNRL